MNKVQIAKVSDEDNCTIIVKTFAVVATDHNIPYGSQIIVRRHRINLIPTSEELLGNKSISIDF